MKFIKRIFVISMLVFSVVLIANGYVQRSYSDEDVLAGINGTIYTIVEDSNNMLYLGGEFTQVGGTSAMHIIKLDPESGLR